jgi:hypothetical protein
MPGHAGTAVLLPSAHRRHKRSGAPSRTAHAHVARSEVRPLQLSDHAPWAPAPRWQPSLPTTDAAAPLDGTGFCPMGA